MRFFHSLRGKLTLTFTLVTVLALLALEILGGIALLFISGNINSDRSEYFSDVIYTLYPQARVFLQPGEEDLSGLQNWLDDVYASGKASMDPQYLFDSPAAGIVQNQPIYIIDPDGKVLAQSPGGKNSLVGRTFTPPDFRGGQEVIETALEGRFNSSMLITQGPDGNYMMAVPVAQDTTLSNIVGVIILTVEPSPPLLLAYGPIVLGGMMATAALLLLGIIPFGSVFGYAMSRGLTRRLQALTEAADAWSEGDFRPLPVDRERDEIGTLSMRMRHMAERVQNLLQTQQALAMVEERNRLARELHDTVKQQTFATLMQVRAARNLIESDPSAAGQHLSDAESLIKNAQKDLSMIIAELRPAAMDGQGLATALQSYIEIWSQHTRIPATLHVQNERSLPLAVEQALYRVTQEALANISRHSHASAVSVRLDFSPDKVCLQVTDNGVGFDPQAVQGSGFGLVSMNERLQVFGGQLTIQSATDQGTTLTAVVPESKIETTPVSK